MMLSSRLTARSAAPDHHAAPEGTQPGAAWRLGARHERVRAGLQPVPDPEMRTQQASPRHPEQPAVAQGAPAAAVEPEPDRGQLRAERPGAYPEGAPTPGE